jgi:hypothetical protein
MSTAVTRLLFTLFIPVVVGAQGSAGDSCSAAVAERDSATSPTVAAYVIGTFGPRSVAGSEPHASFDQWRDEPVNLPQDRRGFVDRLGGRYGANVIAGTIEFGIARTTGVLSADFHPLSCGSRSLRWRHALLAPFRVRSRSGTSLSLIPPATALMSGVLVTIPSPLGLRLRDGLLNGAAGVAGQAALAAVREFWPFRWRPPFL